MLKLSFILPCYNVAPYLGRCIESIEHQDIPQTEYEVICVDDCSKDNTVEVIKEYQKQYPNIRLMCHTENKTAGGARNTGLDAARGEYIWCVDPDDSIERNVLNALLQKAEKLSLDMLLFNLRLTEENGREREIIKYIDLDAAMSGVEYVTTQCAPRYLYQVAGHTCCLYNRLFLEKHQIRYPKIRSSQDVVFEWMAILYASRTSAISTICYHIFRRPDSTTGSRGKLHADKVISASLLYVHEVGKLLNLSENAIIDKNLRHEMSMSINDDSRKVLQMSNKEQMLFYREICRYTDIIAQHKDIMNRKTKVIFNYKLPYPIWQSMMWMYMIKGRCSGK